MKSGSEISFPSSTFSATAGEDGVVNRGRIAPAEDGDDVISRDEGLGHQSGLIHVWWWELHGGRPV